MIKKISSAVTAAVLALGIAPITAVAFTDSDGNEYKEGTYECFEYRKYRDHVVITGCDKSVTEAVIPEKIDGFSVTVIGEAAFRFCEALTSVTIPNGVKEICGGAFSECSSLTEITIPDSVKTIESGTMFSGGTFGGCESLTGIYVSDKNKNYSSEDGVLFNKDKTVLVAYPNNYDTKYVIPDGVTKIGSYAFSWDLDLAEITIPDSVVSIGSAAFCWCESLTGLTLPDSVEKIGNNSFSNCNALTELTIPGSVKEIGNVAFFQCEGLESVTLSDGVTVIGSEMFENCGKLSEINIPDSVEIVGVYAFYGTPWLENRRTENPLVIVNDVLIDGFTCEGDIVIPDGVTSICENAFGAYFDDDYKAVNNTKLTSVTIPESVTLIGEDAFNYCENLTEVTILNPDCEIFDEKGTISNGMFSKYEGIIRGHADSTAQAYAEKYEYSFEELNLTKRTFSVVLFVCGIALFAVGIGIISAVIIKKKKQSI